MIPARCVSVSHLNQIPIGEGTIMTTLIRLAALPWSATLAPRSMIWRAALVFAAAWPLQALAQNDVPQWSVHEITLTAVERHKNVYPDVTVTATFNGPGGASKTVKGLLGWRAGVQASLHARPGGCLDVLDRGQSHGRGPDRFGDDHRHGTRRRQPRVLAGRCRQPVQLCVGRRRAAPSEILVSEAILPG